MKIPVHQFKRQLGNHYWTEDEHIGWLATDVYDKDGREIFEGDLVKINGTFAGAVYFREGAFRAGGMLIKDYNDGEIEIVGHITED